MREKLYLLFLILIISSTKSFCKNNKTAKSHKTINANNIRGKRSAIVPEPILEVNNDLGNDLRELNPMENNERIIKSNRKYDIDQPFWSNRGRRSSEENLGSDEFFDAIEPNKNFKLITRMKDSLLKNHELILPSRISDDMYEIEKPFWGNRGRRQEDEVQFWGNRGRRTDEPFWGNRGRRNNEPWINRGTQYEIAPSSDDRARTETDPFWGNRGKRQTESDPFWGNRGKRENSQMFWGSRGRREDTEPFWGNRGRRGEAEPFWGNRGRRVDDLKQYIGRAIRNAEENINFLSRLKKDDTDVSQKSFWENRGRNSKLKYLFNGPPRGKTLFPLTNDKVLNFMQPHANTVNDDRLYAEQPHYIVVERSSRSSAEDDPYFISRGKKKIHGLDFKQATRDRRGAIEELVKSVRNDPYYIARGKKNDMDSNATTVYEDLVKGKGLICATIDLIDKKSNGKVKREVDERDRRTILNKLAARLQVDPYFASRGKKSLTNDISDENVEEFMNRVIEMCN